MKDSEGNYVKTACVVYQAPSYDGAFASCLSHGMQLFKSTSDEDLNTIVEHANSVWPIGHLWIEGRNGNECSIIYRHSGYSFVKTARPCSTESFYICEHSEFKYQWKLLSNL